MMRVNSVGMRGQATRPALCGVPRARRVSGGRRAASRPGRRRGGPRRRSTPARTAPPPPARWRRRRRAPTGAPRTARARADTTPTPTAPNSVARNDRASSRLVATGSTISAAMSSTPTMRIAITTVTAVSTASIGVERARGDPGDARRVFVEHDREQRASGERDGDDDHRAERDAPSTRRRRWR